jgi:hypothetical protein
MPLSNDKLLRVHDKRYNSKTKHDGDVRNSDTSDTIEVNVISDHVDDNCNLGFSNHMAVLLPYSNVILHRYVVQLLFQFSQAAITPIFSNTNISTSWVQPCF